MLPKSPGFLSIWSFLNQVPIRKICFFPPKRQREPGFGDRMESSARRDGRSPEQAAGYMKKKESPVSRVPTGAAGRRGITVDGAQYGRRGSPDCTAKARNILGRMDMHGRQAGFDGKCFGDRETETTAGKGRQGRDVHAGGTVDRLHPHGGARIRQGARTRGKGRNQAVVAMQGGTG